MYEHSSGDEHVVCVSHRGRRLDGGQLSAEEEGTLAEQPQFPGHPLPAPEAPGSLGALLLDLQHNRFKVASRQMTAQRSPSAHSSRAPQKPVPPAVVSPGHLRLGSQGQGRRQGEPGGSPVHLTAVTWASVTTCWAAARRRGCASRPLPLSSTWSPCPGAQPTPLSHFFGHRVFRSRHHTSELIKSPQMKRTAANMIPLVPRPRPFGPRSSLGFPAGQPRD